MAQWAKSSVTILAFAAMTDLIRIYHNPRCSKSRAACTLIEESGNSAQIIEYLKTPPSKEDLRNLLNMLGIPAAELVRKNEEIYKAHYANQHLTDDEWLDVLATHPILIERPIAVRGHKAVLARPPEKILELL